MQRVQRKAARNGQEQKLDLTKSISPLAKQRRPPLSSATRVPASMASCVLTAGKSLSSLLPSTLQCSLQLLPWHDIPAPLPSSQQAPLETDYRRLSSAASKRSPKPSRTRPFWAMRPTRGGDSSSMGTISAHGSGRTPEPGICEA